LLAAHEQAPRLTSGQHAANVVAAITIL